MESLLNFFSNLILFTAGCAVSIFWMIIIFEIVDTIIEMRKGPKTIDKNEVDF